jgi:hypothetical protein
MKITLLRALCGLNLALIFSSPTVANPTGTNLLPRLTVELRDGSRVVGASVEKNVKFHSALLGDFKLAVKDIRAIDCLTTNSAKLTTSNGDVLMVGVADLELRFTTSFGKVTLPANTIQRVSVSTSGMRAGLVAAWLADGDKNERDIVVPNSPDLVSMQQTRQLTLEMWIKPNSIPPVFPVLLSKGGNQPDGVYGGYEFLLNANGDNDLVFVSGGCCYETRSAHGRWVNQHLGEWIHVAFTLDDQTKAAQFYVNGQPTNDAYNEGTSNALNFELPNNLYIGTPDPASNANRARFDGEMRDVMLFNRALTAAEIREDYEASKKTY